MTRFFDTANIDEIEGLVSDRTRFLYMETPTNPTLKLGAWSFTWRL